MPKKVTGEQLKFLFAASPKTVAHNLGRMMRDFGYPHATDEVVEKEIAAQLAGAEPCNLSYGLWIQAYLRDGCD